MATPIDAEPVPRERPLAWRDPFPSGGVVRPLPRAILTPDVPFLSVLASRGSDARHGRVPEAAVASVLWHAASPRERRPAGRFGLPWESRNAPSAGGLHPLRLLAIPIGRGAASGVYDARAHALVDLSPDEGSLRALNAASVVELAGSTGGTTLQVVADPTKTAACYDRAESLVLRDVGALTMTVCLVAAALGLAAVPLGRTGTDVVRAAGLGLPFVGLGAIHLAA